MSTFQAKTATPEQQAIAGFAQQFPSKALIVEALAGTGKTTTIVEQVLPRLSGTTLLLAYNKAIQRELQLRTPAELQFTTTISTVHAFGLSQLRRSGDQWRKVKVEGGKLHFHLRNILDRKPSFRQLFNERRKGASEIVRLVSHAKSAGMDLGDILIPGTSGYVCFPDSTDDNSWLRLIEHFNMEDDFEEANLDLDDVLEIARYLLKENNRATGTIDFDDMVYFPLLFNANIQQYNHVIIDEAQDISSLRAELARRACSERGRLIAVGDRNQAIYGFTGANAAAMDDLRQQHQADTLPLTICWRCSAAVITDAQAYVPTIRAKPGAVAGQTSHLDITEMLDLDLPLGSAVLCRLNRPNVALALELLRRGKPVKIEGRDLGRTLLEHMKKALPTYGTAPLDELSIALDDYLERKTGELLAKKKDAQASFLADECEAASLLIDRAQETGGTSFAHVEALVQTLFADDIPPAGKITLSSVHKSKGREWPTVFILGFEDYMPHWLAKMPWEREQERNLIYVAITRAEQSLFYVNGVKSWLDSRRG